MGELTNHWWSSDRVPDGFTDVVEIIYDGPSTLLSGLSWERVRSLIMQRPLPPRDCYVELASTPTRSGFRVVAFINRQRSTDANTDRQGTRSQSGSADRNAGWKDSLAQYRRVQDSARRELADPGNRGLEHEQGSPHSGSIQSRSESPRLRGGDMRSLHCEVIKVREPDGGGDEGDDMGIELHAVKCGSCGALNVFDEARYNVQHVAARRIEEVIADSDLNMISTHQWWEVEGVRYTNEMEAFRAMEAIVSARRLGLRS